MKITYLEHSGFVVTLSDVILVFDYYRDPSHALHKALDANPDLPVIFFVSHRHEDHHNTGIYEMAQNHRRVYVMSNDVPARNIPSTLAVAGMSAGDSLENLPGNIRVKAYGSTDSGVSFVVTLPDGRTVFHAGDLNDWHWQDETPVKEMEREEQRFHSILDRIAADHPGLTVAMFPVDPRLGTDFARGASKLLKAIKVDYFFPMHFGADWKEACNFRAYVPQDCHTQCHGLHTPGSHVVI